MMFVIQLIVMIAHIRWSIDLPRSANNHGQLTHITPYFNVTCLSQLVRCRKALSRLGNWDSSVMPVLEYAGGLRFDQCWYTTTGGSRTLDGAFPGLLRIGSSGMYIRSTFATSMNSAFTNLARIDGYMMIYGDSYTTRRLDCSSWCRWIYTYHNSDLSSISNSFSSLESVGSYMCV